MKLKHIILHEKTPLSLLVFSQAYIIFLWLAGFNVYSLSALTVTVAVITAVSIDSVVVSTTFSKHRNPWSMMTAVVAMTASILVVIDLFYALHMYWLHASFSVLIFMYSQHLAAERSIALESGKNEAITGNKDALIHRLLDVLGDDIADYKIAKIVGGKTKTTMENIKEIRGMRLEEKENNQE